MNDYPILDVSNWQVAHDEQLGTKEKFWVRHPRPGDADEWLFKLPRPGTGEHWAEKAAAEIARVLGIPHAVVELARRGDDVGSLSLSFAPRTSDRRSLILGNELLTTIDASYRRTENKPRAHAVELVLRFLARAVDATPTGTPHDHRLTNAADVFAGYLMLDALIGNTDRHHENWGVLTPIKSLGKAAELAPSFDHASSLGREICDEERMDRLRTKDRRRTVERYCARGRSPFFAPATAGGRALSPREAFEVAAHVRPGAAEVWLGRLETTEPRALHETIERIPDSLASGPAKHFAMSMLDCNRRFLLEQVNL